MSFLAQTTKAPAPKTGNISVLGLGLAIVTVAMVTSQLFSYEKFPEVLKDMWLPGGLKSATLVAALLVVTEVFALPFLLRMRLSPLMRGVSMVCGWLMVAIWLGLTLWQNVTANTIGNAGIFGATLSVPAGWWTTLVFVALGILVGWVSWGMWPSFDSKKK